nr:MAG TPA: hypothetical protein [Caudoviricetes sp.]
MVVLMQKDVYMALESQTEVHVTTMHLALSI